MELIIANKNFERIGMIENAQIIWSTRYYKSGDFEIYVSATQENLELITSGFYVIRDDKEKNNIGVIENYTVASKPEEGDMITVTGKLAGGYFLKTRVVAHQTQLSGNVQQELRNLVYSNIINPTDPNRKIDFIHFGELDGTIFETLEKQITGANLLEKVEEICAEKGVGFRMNLKNNELFFEIYKGTDRSYNQIENLHIVFSDEYDNLTDCQYVNQKSEIKNFAYVAGEGEGLDRKIVATYNTQTEPIGQDRFEIWVDQRNISSNNEEITVEELNNQMMEEGLENLTTLTEALDGNVLMYGYTYDEDFTLGDIVQIYKSNWNVGIAMRIIECIESVNSTGESIVLTFGI